jgi:hypothetical protein
MRLASQGRHGLPRGPEAASIRTHVRLSGKPDELWCDIMRARHVALSPMRRLITDSMRLAVPSVVLQRHMRIGALVAARAACKDRPAWPAIFLKAFAIVADEFPSLRRAYVKLPWPHLAEYPQSVAAVAVEREYGGEPGVQIMRIKAPAQAPLAEINKAIRQAAAVPMDQSKEFRRAIAIGKLPWFVRRPLWWLGVNVARQRANFFGTFCVSVSAPFGAEGLHPIGPYTTIMNYGPIGADGGVNVRFCIDHRVTDGAVIGRAMKRMEEVLNTTVLAELKSLEPADSEMGIVRSMP